eukprot:TRINITY_DN1060_c0_g2_i6.p1 TRINITY_DN1060_c0_g2~~TRINITY_DN1060_c0_g2_i6.p1  ORF type:complete len:333 (-),score=102.28 TRINITY_DN1060_c0_g2_i6:60-1058(-)
MRCARAGADPAALAAYGAALLGSAEIDQAAKAFQRALQVDPLCRAAALGLGAALFAQGKVDEAIATVQKAAATRSSWQVELRLGQLLAGANRHAEAVPHLQTALQLNPISAVAQQALEEVQSALKGGDATAAEPDAEEAEQGDGDAEGDEAEAEQQAQEMEQEERSQFVEPSAVLPQGEEEEEEEDTGEDDGDLRAAIAASLADEGRAVPAVTAVTAVTADESSVGLVLGRIATSVVRTRAVEHNDSLSALATPIVSGAPQLAAAGARPRRSDGVTPCQMPTLMSGGGTMFAASPASSEATGVEGSTFGEDDLAALAVVMQQDEEQSPFTPN